MIIKNTNTGHKWEVVKIQKKQIKVKDVITKKTMLIEKRLLSKNWELA